MVLQTAPGASPVSIEDRLQEVDVLLQTEAHCFLIESRTAHLELKRKIEKGIEPSELPVARSLQYLTMQGFVPVEERFRRGRSFTLQILIGFQQLVPLRLSHPVEEHGTCFWVRYRPSHSNPSDRSFCDAVHLPLIRPSGLH